MLVAGSSVFGSADPAAALRSLSSAVGGPIAIGLARAATFYTKTAMESVDKVKAGNGGFSCQEQSGWDGSYVLTASAVIPPFPGALASSATERGRAHRQKKAG